MEQAKRKIDLKCPSPDISAYLDGELSPDIELQLEMHITNCRTCADDLNLQKSFLNALGSSLGRENDIELPQSFTKTVVANAESRVSGLRHPHERRNAAFICAGLLVAVLVGTNTESTFVAATSLAETFLAVAGSVWNFIYGVALASTIVSRSLVSAFVFNSNATIAFVIALFVVSLYVFSRLLGGFRRT